MAGSSGGEEGFEFFGGFVAKARHGGDFLDAGEPEFLDGSEVFKDGGFAAFAHAGEFIEEAFRDFFQAEASIVGVGEAVGFVTDALEKFKRSGMAAEAEGKRSVRQVNFFKFFCQANDRDLFQSQLSEFVQSGVELAFAAVNKNEVGHFGGEQR